VPCRDTTDTTAVPDFRRHRAVLDAGELAAIRAAILASPLLGRSTLAGSFRASRGFAMTFTHEGRASLVHRFPELGRFLQLALVAPDLRAWPKRLFGRGAAPPNAFFLNVLAIPAGAGVGRHIDGTLQDATGLPELTPVVVSVLYLQVPQGPGGRLRLFAGEQRLASIAPQEGTLVHFNGSLSHDVEPVPEAAGSLRLSIVCEQYVLAPGPLARVPRLRVESKAGFGAYLEDHRARSPQPG
jgi:hypothetical protein